MRPEALFHFPDLSGHSVEMDKDHDPDIRVHRKRFFQRFRRHIPGIILGIDKDSLAVFVGDGIDGGIELDEVFMRIEPDGPAVVTDHADGHGMGQAERRADGDRPMSGLDFFRIGEGEIRRFAGIVDLEDGKIGQGVASDQFGLEFTAVVPLSKCRN